MRILSIHRPPTLLERTLGYRRARAVRRRAGWAAVAIGVMLLRSHRNPRRRTRQWALVAIGVAGLLAVGWQLPLR